MGAYWDVLDGFYSGATSTAQYGTTNTSSSSYDGVEEVSSYTLNKEFTVERSLLTVNTDQSDKTVSIISKNSNISTQGQYYAFGTTMFFKPTLEDLISR